MQHKEFCSHKKMLFLEVRNETEGWGKGGGCSQKLKDENLGD